ncbi:hypothetical protein A3840_06790 [Devosia elaeis]|uniref:Uncharacterized protein n=1 Tax=Devosia elaeis TaxID=1770058 RepID=A0A178I1Y1_9HYPH|nr:hypothetical protein A3840_06790 [Devosia elaeis]
MHASTKAAARSETTTRRPDGAHGEGGARAMYERAGFHSPASGAATSYQGSVEPFRKPDHKAKRHSRPANWAQRHERRERQLREWAP